MARNDDKKNVRCSFCGKPQSLVDRLIAGNGSYICDECIRLCMNILDEDYTADAKGKTDIGIKASDVPKPVEIRKKLDEYIIGQERAKIALSVAVYNHYKRIIHGDSSDVELQKGNHSESELPSSVVMQACNSQVVPPPLPNL